MRYVVVGGGAAGVFGALSAKQHHPDAEVILLEKSAKLLAKVRVSGGGRCNVTHHCFDPKELVKNYPRGHRELLGPFHRFAPEDTISWFEERGVPLKVEADGRMFPTTDSSQTIIDCLLNEARRRGVSIRSRQKIEAIQKKDDFVITLADGEEIRADRVLLATGSAPQGHRFAEALGHTIVPSVPSLFTFNVPNFALKPLSGASVEKATLRLEGFKHEQEGPLLITHWGFSGPAAIKLSAWGARFLAEKQYQAMLIIDWGVGLSDEWFAEAKQSSPNRTIGKEVPGLPKKLWRALVERAGIDPDKRIGTLSKKEVNRLVELLKRDTYQVSGKTTHKEEFVTCGGVALNEVNFKTMESRICPGLHFAGEILDIDGVTGGFNFQNAWTTSWIAGQS